MNVKIAGGALMPIPFDIEGVGIHDEGFANTVAIDLQDHFQIGRHAVMHIKLDSAPTQAERILEIVDALKIAAKFAKHGFCVVFRYLHIVVRNKTEIELCTKYGMDSEFEWVSQAFAVLSIMPGKKIGQKTIDFYCGSVNLKPLFFK